MKKIFALLALVGFVGLAGGCRYHETEIKEDADHVDRVEVIERDRPPDVHIYR